MTQRSETSCFFLALAWLIVNASLGLCPVIFLAGVNLFISDEKISHEIQSLLNGGLVLFVCGALMGGTIWDMLSSKLKFKNLGFFCVNVSPFILIGMTSLFLLLKLLGHIKFEIFSSGSKYYIFMVTFTFLYCTLCKTILYYNENRGHA